MARGINKVTLLGNIGSDPEVRYTQSGMAVTRVSLATTSVRNDRDGNRQEQTQWHRVTFFGKLAEIAGEYLRRGSQVYVEGEIRYDKYTGQDGIERYSTDIIANEMLLVGGRGGGEAGAGRGNEGYGGGYEQRSTRPQAASRRETPQRQAPPSPVAPPPAEFAGDGFDDDDIPF